MKDLDLPDSISDLVDHLQVVQVMWQGIPIQLPKFAVYAVLDDPVFDFFFYRNCKKMAMVSFGRYQVPVIDPFRADLDSTPAHIVIISHTRANRFGLYAYPADSVDAGLRLPISHRSVKRIVKDFV